MFSLVLNSCRSRLGQYAGSLLVVVMASALFTALATIVDRVQRAGLGHGPERSAESLMGLIGGTSGLAALLLVGNTLSLVVQQRRREIGVLRTIGASPAQIRTGIVAETLVIALAGGVAGALAGSAAAGPALRWLIANQVFPSGPEAGFSPQGVAIGVLSTAAVAVLAALAAVYRPTRTSALAGLREAEIERRAMPVGRLVAAVLTLALAGAVWQRYEHETGASQAVNGAMGLCLFLLVSAWLLAPLLVRPLLVAGALPGRLLSRYSGHLAAVTSAHAVRRVAAMSGPVLIAVGLSAALLCSGAASDAITKSRVVTSASSTNTSSEEREPGERQLEESEAEEGSVEVAALREQQRRNEVGTRVLMAPLIVFSAIGILNTLLLATRQRRGEFAVLRLTGATGAQLLRMLFWESVVVVVGGVVTAGAVLGVYLSVLSRRLAPYGVDFDSVVPGESLARVVLSCAALGLLGVLVPGVLVLRVRAVGAARARD
ncbi:FtsX-like permease family protein [Streptomyces europaeiscabiei]|uniref:FtsX-like permease family protein n=1 Tax=Streptomyces europaeiscabiei TaxID=146819 RepID=A0AAJ2PSZ7_9ACTN|nr:FtsX-like permease family protein [Streptomyces europaeiscabiei]MDX3132621.1 FtsX-like permease family protein [Streptomyces europaeiscabiei]